MSKLFGLIFLSLMIQYSLQTEDPKAKFTNAAKSCIKLHVKTQEEMSNLQNMYPAPEVKRFFHCLAIAYNVVNSDGSPRPENIKNLLIAMKIPETKADNIIQACVKTSNTPTDSAFEMIKCFQKMMRGTR